MFRTPLEQQLRRCTTHLQTWVDLTKCNMKPDQQLHCPIQQTLEDLWNQSEDNVGTGNLQIVTVAPPAKIIEHDSQYLNDNEHMFLTMIKGTKIVDGGGGIYDTEG